MIKVVISRDEFGMVNGFHVNGHAGYDEYGQDIVCAAVSVLVTNTINSIEQLTDDGLTYEVDERNGDVKCSLTDGISRESWVLLESMMLGLQGIEDSYSKKYLKIIDK